MMLAKIAIIMSVLKFYLYHLTEEVLTKSLDLL